MKANLNKMMESLQNPQEAMDTWRAIIMILLFLGFFIATIYVMYQGLAE